MESEKRSLKDIYAPLLKQFINEKLSGFVEPERKDVPRGMEIGFSRPKYTASLIRLTNLRLGDIADSSKLSYPSLRVWDTENTFEKEVERHCKEFIEDIILKEIMRKAQEGREELEKLHSEQAKLSMDKESRRISKRQSEVLDTLFSDYSQKDTVDDYIREMVNYSGTLQVMLLREFDELRQREDNAVRMLVDFITHRFLEDIGPVRAALFNRYMRKLKSSRAINRTIRTIASSREFEKEKKETISDLRDIEQDLLREEREIYQKIKRMRK